MCVWTNRQHRVIPRSLSVTFIDDSNSTFTNIADAQISLDETVRFDTKSGQKIHPGKLVGWATQPELGHEMAQLQILGHPLPLKEHFRLVGAHIVLQQTEYSQAADDRLRAAIQRMVRIARVPASIIDRSILCESLAASKIATGLELNGPTAHMVGAYNKQLFATLIRDGRKWYCMWIILTYIVKGHSLEPTAIGQRETLLALRRQVLRCPKHLVYLTDLHALAQNRHTDAAGPVHRFNDLLDQLRWTWPSPDLIYDDQGIRLPWLDLPRTTMMHYLRAAQRRAFLRRVPSTRHDLGAIDHDHGLDDYANRWLLTSKSQKFALNPWRRGLLRTFMAGGGHTQQRLSRADISKDPSPKCRFCDQAEETQAHILLECPCWDHHRTRLRRLVADTEWNQWPPHTRHCALVDDIPELTALTRQLSHDPPQPRPQPPEPDEQFDWDTLHRYHDHDVIWTYAATDGACRDGRHPKLARAGLGVYYADNHHLNLTQRIHGLVQTSTHAEAWALAQLVRMAEDRVHVLIDNLAVATAFANLLAGQPDTLADTNDEPWTLIKQAVQAKPHQFRISHVRSHLGSRGIDDGRIGVIAEYLNRQADRLATMGAQYHAVPNALRRRAIANAQLAIILQYTAAHILDQRANTRPMDHRTAGFTDAQLAALQAFQGPGLTPEPQEEPADDDWPAAPADDDEPPTEDDIFAWGTNLDDGELPPREAQSASDSLAADPFALYRGPAPAPHTHAEKSA